MPNTEVDHPDFIGGLRAMSCSSLGESGFRFNLPLSKYGASGNPPCHLQASKKPGRRRLRQPRRRSGCRRRLFIVMTSDAFRRNGLVLAIVRPIILAVVLECLWFVTTLLLR